MKKELAEYINGTRNVIKDEFIIGREKMRNAEMIFVSVPGYDSPMYALINAKKAKEKYRVQETGGEEVARIEKRKPKGTGGKPAYAMLMLAEFEKCVDKISVEAAGLLLKLAPCLEWNTGRIICKHSGMSMTQQAMSRRFCIKKARLRSLLAELAKAGVMSYNAGKRAYFASGNFIKKGMSS